MLSPDDFLKNWPGIKSGIRNLWGQLSEEEIERHQKNVYDLSPLVEERYGETKASITQKLNDLIESFDNPTDTGRSPLVSSFERNPLDGYLT